MRGADRSAQGVEREGDRLCQGCRAAQDLQETPGHQSDRCSVEGLGGGLVLVKGE